jgi:hypothetical protein
MKSKCAKQVSTAASGKRGNVANLKPFPKGVSGNPSGSNQFSHGRGDARRKALAAADRALAVLIAQLDSPDEKVAQNAAKEILDRAVGKPVQAIATTDSMGMDRPAPPPMVIVPVRPMHHHDV